MYRLKYGVKKRTDFTGENACFALRERAKRRTKICSFSNEVRHFRPGEIRLFSEKRAQISGLERNNGSENPGCLSQKNEKNAGTKELRTNYAVGLEVTNWFGLEYAFWTGISTANSSACIESSTCGRGRAAALNKAKQNRSETETQQTMTIVIPLRIAQGMPGAN